VSSAGAPRWAIHADAWAEPVDVPSINRAASDLILQRIEDVRRAGAREDLALTSSSLLLLGPAGAGKTHLFTRLRRSAGRRAVFIHTRPQIGVEPTPRFVLRSIVESLKQPIAGDEQRQIDLVAGAILAAHEGDRRFPLAKVEEARGLSPDERRTLFDRVVGRVEDRFSGVLPSFLFRLLEVPFADRQDRRALLTWLSGGEPSVVDLERLGAGGPLAEIDLMGALATLGIAAAYGAPVVLVFDQLENLAEDEGKTSRIHAHARLVSDLRDTVRGLTIVQMALDAEWMTRIHPALHASDKDRLEETVVRLVRPTSDERRELLERWREALPDEDRAPPFPHPFQPAEVERWIHDRGMTPRMLMQSCSEALLARLDPSPAPPEPTPEDPSARLGAQWEEAIQRARREIDEAAQQNHGVPAERLAGGLLAALGNLAGARAEPIVHAAGPAIRVTRATGASADVVIAQQQNHRSLAAAIRHAGTLTGDHLLLRERALAIAPTWKEVERCLVAFTAAPGASFVQLDREDTARLLALEAFVTAARSHDLSADDGSPVPPATVLAWAAQNLRAATWAPVEAILSVPARAPARTADPVPARAPARAADPVPARAPARAAAPGADAVPVPVHSGATGPTLAALSRLRVASVERLLREARAVDATLTRADLVAELRRSSVRFFGESIVALPKGAP
jgi:hypothetical protein